MLARMKKSASDQAIGAWVSEDLRRVKRQLHKAREGNHVPLDFPRHRPSYLQVATGPPSGTCVGDAHQGSGSNTGHDPRILETNFLSSSGPPLNEEF